MKTRVIRIGFKDMRTALKDFVETGEALTRGEEVKEEAGVYFTNIEAFRIRFLLQLLTQPIFS